MKRHILLLSAFILFFSCVIVNYPVSVQAEGSQLVPFTISVGTSTSTSLADIIFSSREEVDVYIYEEGEKGKQPIFDGIVESQCTISDIVFNKSYQINIKAQNDDFYTGTFSLYNKPESDFRGIISDINKVEQNSHMIANSDDERMLAVQEVYEVEKNNNFKTANKLFGSSIAGKINSKIDVDYFKTMFYQEGDCIFLLSNIPNEKDYDIYIFDDNQKQIASSCSTSDMESFTMKNIKQNRWYYIKVVGYKGSFDKINAYNLVVNQIPKKIDDYGHTMESAKVATSLKPSMGEIMFAGNSNYFKFTPSESGIYIINTNGTIDTYGRLYNQDKKLIAVNDDKANDIYGNFELKQKLEANELYYIQINHYSTGTGPYNLNISKDNLVPNNNIDNPTVVTIDTDYSAYFNNSDSQQWFCFTPSETGSYKIYSSGICNTYGTLLDSSKTKEIIRSGNFMESGQFVLANTLLKDNKYYIKTVPHNFSVLNSTFDLRIVKVDTPSDVDFEEQWGMLNKLNGLDINVLPAWQYTRGDGFKIGIADSGTYIEHEDLKANIDMELSYNFLHDMKDVFPLSEPMHQNSAVAGHGTHVAGIIGALNNDKGVAGVAPEIDIVPLKVIGRRIPDNPIYTGSIAAFIKSISYAKENGIKIINCSFGGSAPFVSEQEAMYNAQDILFVIAAGNTGQDLSEIPEYPASYGHDNSLVVAALNEMGELALFSNYGGPTDIAAPGEAIYSTFPDDTYGSSSGTSMAAPFVAAVAGLVWSNNTALDAVAVKNIVTDTNNVTKLNNLNNKVLSGGLLNAFKAVTNNTIMESRIRNIRSIDDIQRNIFGHDIKESISNYAESIDDSLKTNQIIVKFSDESNIDDRILQINKNNFFEKLSKIEYLELIDAYVLEVSSIEEADVVVNVLNTYSDVVYAEINYLRDLQ